MKFTRTFLASSISLALVSITTLSYAQTDVTGPETSPYDLRQISPDLNVLSTGSIITSGANAVSLGAGAGYIGDVNNAGTISSFIAISIQNTFNGAIVNSSNAVITGSNGGIFISGNGDVGSIINAGDILSTSAGAMNDSLYAIDIQQSATVGAITNNAGGDINGVIGGLIIDESVLTGDLMNNAGATIQSSSGDGVVVRGATAQINGDINNNGGTISGVAGIAIEGGAAVQGDIINSGTITGTAAAIVIDNSSISRIVNEQGGVINGGSTAAIIVNQGSLGFVDNAGTINGDINFGSTGSFSNSGTAGNIEGANTVVNSGTVGNVTLAASSGGTVYRSIGGTSGFIQGADLIQIESADNGDGVTVSTINGDLTHTGMLLFDVKKTDSAIAGNSQLNVTGAANLTGASINFNVTGIDVFASGDTFNFITAGSLISDINTAQGFDVFDNSQPITFNVVQIGNRLVAVIGNIDYTPVLQPSLQGTREAGNLNRLAGAFNNAVLNGANGPLSGTDFGIAANRLATIDVSGPTGQANYRRALASLDPETIDGNVVAAMAADIAAAATISNRVSALRGDYGISGAIAGDALSIHGFWVQLYDGSTDQGVRDGVDGFDADTFGVAMGVDMPLNELINIGLALSHAGTDVDGKQESNEMTIDSLRLAFYGSYNADDYYIDGQFSYADNDYESSRVIDPLLSPMQLIAKGDHGGDQYSMRVRGGYPIALENGLYVTPKAEMNYTHLSEDGYTETGAGSLGLNVSTEDVEVLVIGLGVKLAYPMTTKSEVTWIPELSLDYLYDTIGDEVEVDANFIGVSAAAFITNGASAEQQAIKTSLRLRAFGQGNLSVSGGLDYIEKDDYRSKSLSATVRYDF